MGADQLNALGDARTAGADMATLATWNLEWAAPASSRGRRVADVLDGLANIVVATECEIDCLPRGHVVDAGTDWGYTVLQPGRRKVALWSAHPWTDVSRFEHRGLPGGRLVAATTDTPLGPLSVLGICIPWRNAHVASGRRDKRPWEEHAAFLDHLPDVVRSMAHPFVVAGDFNQRIPRSRQPSELADALDAALQGLAVPTAGETRLGRLIDHLALSPDLVAQSMDLLPARDEQGTLSDHVGAVVRVCRR